MVRKRCMGVRHSPRAGRFLPTEALGTLRADQITISGEMTMNAALGRKMVVEGVGAFALSFIGVGAIIYGGSSGGLTTVALAHGLVIAVMVCAVGHISGGHFNPAVTFGFLVTKRIAVTDAVGYWMAQLGGAALGGLLVSLTKPSS